MQLSLYVRRGPVSGEVFPLPTSQVTLIGRTAANHVVLADRTVSATHCVVRPRRSQLGYVLLDARSRHGTRVNGRPAHKAAIGLGDVIRLGPFELEVIETPAGQYAVPPKLPAADRPARFELVRRGWRAEAWPLLPGSATVIGRGRACHITVRDTSVSACHCVLCLDPADDGRMPFVIDLHSRNGTYVSRRAIHRKHLLPGDALVVGDVRLRLRRLKVEEPPPPEPEVEIAPAPARTRAAAAEPVSPGETVEPEPPLVETILFATAEADRVPEEAVAREAAAHGPEQEVLTEADLDRMLADEPETPAAEAIAAEETAEAAPDEPVEEAAQEAPPAPEPADAAAEDTKACEVAALPQPALSAPSPERLLAAGQDDYNEFFGFGHPPFGLTPDPDCFFDSQAHWDALDTLVGWLKSGPPVAVLFGDMGSGKTLVVECLARRLAYRRPAAVVVRPLVDDLSLAAVVGAALGALARLYPVGAAEDGDPVRRWQGAMEHLYSSRGLVALLLDDAHGCAEADLRGLAELLDGEAARGVVRLLLAGDDSLRELVAEPPLAYHLGTSCYLAPLDAAEVAGYLAHRIVHASGRRELPFTRRAVERIAEHSGGVPTLINAIADAALLEAFRKGRHQVGRDTVEQAVGTIVFAETSGESS